MRSGSGWVASCPLATRATGSQENGASLPASRSPRSRGLHALSELARARDSGTSPRCQARQSLPRGETGADPRAGRNLSSRVAVGGRRRSETERSSICPARAAVAGC
ncbi:hypothetical protein J1605_011564 [Eschrichtius robustus]|uniref:Uncharacterized protein n=1 Tax=Eschrichtius robustus TaxID=9764 RepID=A0AB34GPD7_ESCRO|nr:hypothetical protein J1605_011564 [Eschrichtius robustus]